MASDGEEPNRVFGLPRGLGSHVPQGEEPQHVLGVPVGWYGPVDWNRLRTLRHPAKAYKYWRLRRRLGPYAPDPGETDPPPTG